MIDEKKIEDAAKNALSVCVHKKEKEHEIVILGRGDYIDAFKAGINWFLDNLWHDASEEPKEDRLVLTDTQSIANKGHICWQAVKLTPNGFIHNWSNYAKATKITRWLYIEDLLKGASNE